MQPVFKLGFLNLGIIDILGEIIVGGSLFIVGC
jgi:hypothetical protein